MSTTKKPCRERREGLELLACGLLPDDEAPALRRHLDGCSGCRAYAEELTGVTKALQAWHHQTRDLPLPPVRYGDCVEAIQSDSTTRPPPLTDWLRKAREALTQWHHYPRLARWGLAAIWGIILLLHASAPPVHPTKPTASPVTATIELRVVWQTLESLRDD